MSATMIHRLHDWAKASPNAPAQKFKKKGEWNIITAQEYMDRVFYLALYLESCGVGPGEVGGILSYNTPEWVHMELALMLIRARSAGLYPNSTTRDIHYILDHTQATILAVQNKDYFNKIVCDGKTLPNSVRMIVVFDGDTSISPKAISYDQVIEEGKRLADGKKLADYLGRLDAKEGSFMIYTSGTTGNPKGALLSQDNLAFTSDCVTERWHLPFETANLFSFLPLSHIAEKLHSIGVGISRRYLVTFCTKFELVGKELPDAEPTLLLCVPRVWEKMMEGVISKLEKGTGISAKLAHWAMGVGERVAKEKYSSNSSSKVSVDPSKLLSKMSDQLALPIADKLVLSKIRKALGLGKAQLLASGAAPLPAHVAKWFRILGLEIYECYGLTESTGVVSITLPGIECAGTVGKPLTLEGCEFKLGEDGEILSRGRHIFLGYLNDEVNTNETLKDGWLHTGDLGSWTNEGLLKIVGRKKEIMKTSGGKMIAPVPIEEKLKEANFISQVCLVGDNRKYLSALITLSEATLVDLHAHAGAFQDGVLIEKKMLGSVQAEFDRVNKTLASFEQVKRFTVLDREFSIADGEMTPTLKMKRASIEKRFKPLIDLMYPAG
jgi:long-chain acyl-CoA synthetase